MASNFSPPSKSESNFSPPQLKRSTTSEKISTTSAGIHPRKALKFSSQSKNKTEDLVSNVEDKTLVSANGIESAKDETKEVQKRKITFPTFSISLGREKIEADLLAITGSSVGKGSAANKKKTRSPQNSFQDDLLSSTDNSSDSMGSPYNLAVETSMNEPTLLDRRHKMTLEFTTATDNNKNDDMVAINAKDQKQTVVSTELEEPEKFKTWKNTRKVSSAVNQTLTSKTGNVAESLPFESTQPGITPLTQDNGEPRKRTFSTFSVSLTREEIEADFVAMGASMRTRRIKKRPKNVQRELDDLFPGLRLKYRTPDDYRVREDKN